jgi:cobalt-zinc-cadmium efflux system outer membrane protein
MIFWSLLMALLAAQATDRPTTPASPLTLRQALELARASNPSLVAARLRRVVDERGIAVARERTNPDLRYERAKETPRDALGVSQLLEIGGKRGKRIAVAEAVARTGEAELAQVEAEVLADVQQAFFALAGAARRREAMQELRELVVRARTAAADRFEVGDVSRLDVLQAELALDQVDNEAAALDGELQAARTELNVLVGRPAETPTTAADEIDVVDVPDVAQASAAAVSANSALAVLDHQVLEAESRAALARAERVPDPTVEGTVTHGAEPEFDWGYRAAIAIAVPLFTRHTARVEAEEATASLLRAQREAIAERIRGAAAAAAARATAHSEQYRRYRDAILPRSREVESMAEESYRAGQTNLVAFLQSLQAARELRTRALQAAADYESALADLQRAMTTGPK